MRAIYHNDTQQISFVNFLSRSRSQSKEIPNPYHRNLGKQSNNVSRFILLKKVPRASQEPVLPINHRRAARIKRKEGGGWERIFRSINRAIPDKTTGLLPEKFHDSSRARSFSREKIDDANFSTFPKDLHKRGEDIDENQRSIFSAQIRKIVNPSLSDLLVPLYRANRSHPFLPYTFVLSITVPYRDDSKSFIMKQ